MTELTDLLTGAAARRHDIATVFGILRDAGTSQVRIARATGPRQSEISEISSTLNLSELATAQLCGGEVRVGLQAAARVVDKAKMRPSVWVRDRLATLRSAA